MSVNELRNKQIVLQPLAMRVPNAHNVYSPTQLIPKKVMNPAEFLARYADHARSIRVCFDQTPSSDTIFERSENVTGYGFGFDCWYIIESNGMEGSSWEE